MLTMYISGRHSKKLVTIVHFVIKAKFGICIEKIIINTSGYWAIMDLTFGDLNFSAFSYF